MPVEADVGGDNAWHSDLRAGVSYNAKTDLKVPIGFALTAGRYENDANADSETGTWFWNLRLSAQGRSDFTAGVAIGTSYFDTARQKESVQFTDIKIDMRYFY